MKLDYILIYKLTFDDDPELPEALSLSIKEQININ